MRGWSRWKRVSSNFSRLDVLLTRPNWHSTQVAPWQTKSVMGLVAFWNSPTSTTRLFMRPVWRAKRLDTTLDWNWSSQLSQRQGSRWNNKPGIAITTFSGIRPQSAVRGPTATTTSSKRIGPSLTKICRNWRIIPWYLDWVWISFLGLTTANWWENWFRRWVVSNP